MPGKAANVLHEDEDSDQKVAAGTEIEVEQKKNDNAPDIEVVERRPDDDQEDSQVEVTGEADDEAREQHRETAKERRERAKRAKERDRRELGFQKRLIESLEHKITELARANADTRILSLEQQISQANDVVARFKNIKALAVQENKGQDVVDADTVIRDAEGRAQVLTAERDKLRTVAQAPQQQQPAAPAWTGYARDFLSDKPWYDPRGGNEDSLILAAIDKALSREMSPQDPEYWEELQKRAEKRLPHRFKNKNRQDNDDPDDEEEETPPRKETRRGPPVGGGRSSNTGNPNKIYLSPERVQMLKDAGLWDDPKTRARMAQRYSEYDKNNKTASR